MEKRKNNLAIFAIIFILFSSIVITAENTSIDSSEGINLPNEDLLKRVIDTEVDVSGSVHPDPVATISADRLELID